MKRFFSIVILLMLAVSACTGSSSDDSVGDSIGDDVDTTTSDETNNSETADLGENAKGFPYLEPTEDLEIIGQLKIDDLDPDTKEIEFTMSSAENCYGFEFDIDDDSEIEVLVGINYGYLPDVEDKDACDAEIGNAVFAATYELSQDVQEDIDVKIKPESEPTEQQDSQSQADGDTTEATQPTIPQDDANFVPDETISDSLVEAIEQDQQ